MTGNLFPYPLPNEIPERNIICPSITNNQFSPSVLSMITVGSNRVNSSRSLLRYHYVCRVFSSVMAPRPQGILLHPCSKFSFSSMCATTDHLNLRGNGLLRNRLTYTSRNILRRPDVLRSYECSEPQYRKWQSYQLKSSTLVHFCIFSLSLLNDKMKILSPFSARLRFSSGRWRRLDTVVRHENMMTETRHPTATSGRCWSVATRRGQPHCGPVRR